MTLTHCCLLEIKIHSVSCQSQLKPQTWYVKILKNNVKIFHHHTGLHALTFEWVVELEFSKEVILVHVCCGIRHMFMQIGLGAIQLTWAPGSRADTGGRQEDFSGSPCSGLKRMGIGNIPSLRAGTWASLTE